MRSSGSPATPGARASRRMRIVASLCAATVLSAALAEAHDFKVTKTEKRRQKVTFTDTNPCNNDLLEGQGEERIETTREASATETRITEERSLEGYAFSIANPAVRYDYEDTLRQKETVRTSAGRFSITTTRRTHAIRDREHKVRGHIGHDSFFRFIKFTISSTPENDTFEFRVKCSRKGHD
jgi:hypothetical protein